MPKLVGTPAGRQCAYGSSNMWFFVVSSAFACHSALYGILPSAAPVSGLIMPPRPLLILVLVAAIQYPVMSGLPSFERTIGPAGAAGAPPRPPPPPRPPAPPPAGAGACPGAPPPPPCAGAWPARTWASMRTTARPTTMVKPCNLVFIGNLLKHAKHADQLFSTVFRLLPLPSRTSFSLKIWHS